MYGRSVNHLTPPVTVHTCLDLIIRPHLPTDYLKVTVLLTVLSFGPYPSRWPGNCRSTSSRWRQWWLAGCAGRYPPPAANSCLPLHCTASSPQQHDTTLQPNTGHRTGVVRTQPIREGDIFYHSLKVQLHRDYNWQIFSFSSVALTLNPTLLRIALLCIRIQYISSISSYTSQHSKLLYKSCTKTTTFTSHLQEILLAYCLYFMRTNANTMSFCSVLTKLVTVKYQCRQEKPEEIWILVWLYTVFVFTLWYNI